MKTKLTYLTITIALLTTSLTAEARKKVHKWNSSENPEKLGIAIEYKYNKIPKAYSIPLESNIGWSGSYWPSEKGGIAHRWNHPVKEDFEYISPNLYQLKYMGISKVDQLSPAEKLDILNGNYHYPLRDRVWKTTKKSKRKDWAGICHGWAMATLNFPEPKPVTLINKDGIKVNFGSSDIKGLLSYYMAYGHKSKTTQIGHRCFGKLRSFRKGKCKGVNPAAFHIVMGNLLGIYKRGFIADVDRYKEVWNQPVISYEFVHLGQEFPSDKEYKKGIAKKVKVKAYMTYVDELQKVPGAADDDFEDHKMWTPVIGTIHNEKTTKEYLYTLELDFSGKIIGGTWNSDDRPDFLWIKSAPKKFLGKTFDNINSIFPLNN
jgi:hypothetical protein